MVSEHGPPVILDELCVLVMHGFQLHVFLLLFHFMLLYLHVIDHGCSDVTMWKLMLLSWSALS